MLEGTSWKHTWELKVWKVLYYIKLYAAELVLAQAALPLQGPSGIHPRESQQSGVVRAALKQAIFSLPTHLPLQFTRQSPAARQTV